MNPAVTLGGRPHRKVTDKDPRLTPSTLLLARGAAPGRWTRPGASGRQAGDGVLAPRPGLRGPLPSTSAPARPSCPGDRLGWPEGTRHAWRAPAASPALWASPSSSRAAA